MSIRATAYKQRLAQRAKLMHLKSFKVRDYILRRTFEDDKFKPKGPNK